MFCTKAPAPYTFRTPMESDLLGSHARRRFLLPRYEISLEQYWGDNGAEGPILAQKNISVLDAWQRVSAVGHWGVIRTVVPNAVWENY